MNDQPDTVKGTIFHFRCPVCGSEPDEQPLSEFLAQWNRSDSSRLQNLMVHVYVVTWEIRFGQARWLTKRFRTRADHLIRTIFDGKRESAFEPSAYLSRIRADQLHCSTTCPVCQHGPGPRTADNFFTTWNEACKVQASNLYFEVSLILSGLLATPSVWLSQDLFGYFTDIRLAIERVGASAGLPPCPRCGRFTTALFGATKEHPELGRCRWCLDAEGPIMISVSI